VRLEDDDDDDDDYYFAVLGFELRAYTLSPSTSPFLWWVFSR
jgi:hypothetical protein